MNANAADRNRKEPHRIRWNDWLASENISATTGWRRRKLGWIFPHNIGGKLYLTHEDVEEFRRRAKVGEFAKAITTPSSGGEL